MVTDYGVAYAFQTTKWCCHTTATFHASHGSKCGAEMRLELSTLPGVWIIGGNVVQDVFCEPERTCHKGFKAGREEVVGYCPSRRGVHRDCRGLNVGLVWVRQ